MHELPSSLLEPASVTGVGAGVVDPSSSSSFYFGETSNEATTRQVRIWSILEKTLANDSLLDLAAKYVDPTSTTSSSSSSPSTPARRPSPTASELVAASVAANTANTANSVSGNSSPSQPAASNKSKRNSLQRRPRRRSASSLGCLKTAIHRSSLDTRMSDISVDDDLLALAARSAASGSSRGAPPYTAPSTRSSSPFEEQGQETPFFNVLVEAMDVSDDPLSVTLSGNNGTNTTNTKPPHVRKVTGTALKDSISALSIYQAQQLDDYRRLCQVAQSRSSDLSSSKSVTSASATYLEQCAKEGIDADVARPALETSLRLEEYYWNDGIARVDQAAAMAANPVKKGGSDGDGGDGPDGSHRSVQGDGKKKPGQNNNADGAKGPNKITLPPSMAAKAQSLQDNLKKDTVAILRNAEGDSTNPRVASSLKVLSSIYKGRGCDARAADVADASAKPVPITTTTSTAPATIEGRWDLLSRPTYPDCLGRNEDGDFLFTLSRMSFGMLSPGGAVCSIQRITHDISLVCHHRQQHQLSPTTPGGDMPDAVPRKLREALKTGSPRLHGLRKYDTVVHLSIEPPKKHHPRPEDDDLPQSRVQAIMTSKGYMLPDESVENRFAVWFTGGSLRPAEGVDVQAWSDIFGLGNDRRRKLSDQAKAIAAKLLLGAEIPHGMEADGSMTYHFHRPLPGHLDVLYTDDTLQVLKGNRGSVMVHARHGEPTQETATTNGGAPRPNNGLGQPPKNDSKKEAARIA